jgi:FMN reductase
MSKKGLVVLVAGSPASSSRSTAVLKALGERLSSAGATVELYTLDDFDAVDLLRGKFERPTIQRFLASIVKATTLILATPVYKATYAGGLKVIVDLIDPKGLDGKAVLAISTAKLDAHLPLVDESFRKLYAFFRGSIPLPTVGLLDGQLGTPEALTLDENAERALARATEDVLSRLA